MSDLTQNQISRGYRASGGGHSLMRKGAVLLTLLLVGALSYSTWVNRSTLRERGSRLDHNEKGSVVFTDASGVEVPVDDSIDRIEMRTGGRIQRTFFIVNKGLETRRVVRAAASCGCLSHSLESDELAPDKPVRVDLEAAPVKQGHFDVELTLALDDGTSLRVGINANVVYRESLTPLMDRIVATTADVVSLSILAAGPRFATDAPPVPETRFVGVEQTPTVEFSSWIRLVPDLPSDDGIWVLQMRFAMPRSNAGSVAFVQISPELEAPIWLKSTEATQ